MGMVKGSHRHLGEQGLVSVLQDVLDQGVYLFVDYVMFNSLS